MLPLTSDPRTRCCSRNVAKDARPSVAEYVVVFSRRIVVIVRQESVSVREQASCLHLMSTQSSFARPTTNGLGQRAMAVIVAS